MRLLFLDANALFSAARDPESAQGLLVELARQQLIQAVSSDFALGEAERNLALKSEHSQAVWAALRQAVGTCSPPDLETLQWANTIVVAKDAPILASAVRASVDWLVTGDHREFGSLFGTTHRGVHVMPPSQALRMLLDELADT